MMRFAMASGAALVLAAALGVTAASASPVCLRSYNIGNTTVPDAHTIDFHMRDGTVWRNTMRYACPDLKWWGFIYTERGTDEICDNMQAIRVIHTGETCLLGSFTRLPPPVHT